MEGGQNTIKNPTIYSQISTFYRQIPTFFLLFS